MPNHRAWVAFITIRVQRWALMVSPATLMTSSTVNFAELPAPPCTVLSGALRGVSRASVRPVPRVFMH